MADESSSSVFVCKMREGTLVALTSKLLWSSRLQFAHSFDAAQAARLALSKQAYTRQTLPGI
jgi:hypothetical protein